MKELISKLADFLSVSDKTALIIVAGVAAVLILAIVSIIVVCVKKSRKKKQQSTLSDGELKLIAENELKEVKEEKPEKAEPVAQLVAVTEEPKKVEEQVKEEQKIEPEKQTKAPSKAKKPATKKVEVAEEKPVEKKEVKPAKKLNGKWTIGIKKENEYIAQLLASNGEIMLNSEVYSTPEGARNGINTIVNGVKNGKFVVYSDKSGEYYFKLKSANNKLLCAGEIYKTKEGCLSAVESVKRIAEGSPVADGIDASHKYVDFSLAPLTQETLAGAKGKWKIEQSAEGLFFARLYANNGQVMLATEEVSKKATATSAVESVKKNSEAGNFVIDKDKFGRFYYKLRNVQKSVICIGEAYDSIDSCVRAIESVRKFALNSPIV